MRNIEVGERQQGLEGIGKETKLVVADIESLKMGEQTDALVN